MRLGRATALLGLLFVGASAYPPYVRETVQNPQKTFYYPDGGLAAHCLWWPAGTLTYVQSATGDPSCGNAMAAVTAAWESWAAIFSQCGNLTLSETTPPINSTAVGYDPNSSTNTNLIVFRLQNCSSVVPNGDPCLTDNSCPNKYDCWDYGPAGTGGQGDALAITTTSYNPTTGQLYDTDTEINAANFFFTTASSPTCPLAVNPGSCQSCVLNDVQNTMTHEFGHSLGLGHDPDPSSTMYFQTSPGELSKRIIDPGSAQFVCDTYPAGGPSRDCVVDATNGDMGSAYGCSAAGPGGVAVLAGLLLLVARWFSRARSGS